MVVKIKLTKKFTDLEMKKMKGKMFDKVNKIVNYDCDVYKPNGGILLKFRKKVIPEHIYRKAYKNYLQLGFSKSINRGNASGRYKKGKKQYRTYKKTNLHIYEKDNQYVNSGIMGYLDSKNWKRPCRKTAFTKNHFSKYKSGLPFIQSISQQYNKLIPKKYQKQLEESTKSNYTIDGTCFSTVTVNANFRTALHKDSGDFKKGFGNLCVIEDKSNSYMGGYTLFPQYDIGVDVRSGDFLAMDVHEWHCNSSIKKKNKGSTRLAFVCYLRNNMYKCPMLESLLSKQGHLTTKQKIDKIMGGKYTRKNLRRGNFGHQWYQIDNNNFSIKYENKQYTIKDKKKGKHFSNLTFAYDEIIPDIK
jgi:hypothetical protein